MKKKRQTVWVLMRMTYGRFQSEVIVDFVLCHVFSTKHQAEAYIQRFSLDLYEWWELSARVVDCDEILIKGGRYDIFYYSPTGKLLQSLPHNKAERAFRREEAKNQERE